MRQPRERCAVRLDHSALVVESQRRRQHVAEVSLDRERRRVRLGVEHDVNPGAEDLREGHEERRDSLRRFTKRVDCRRYLHEGVLFPAGVEASQARPPLLRELLAVDALEALPRHDERGLQRQVRQPLRRHRLGINVRKRRAVEGGAHVQHPILHLRRLGQLEVLDREPARVGDEEDAAGGRDGVAPRANLHRCPHTRRLRCR
mmetsp:Transcript_45415/g.108392  ORF Transcript_45415/g.108392 Transcript_45415/m.108392 type:complete len:203 (-) Transcript_45415:2651-3259(-)